MYGGSGGGGRKRKHISSTAVERKSIREDGSKEENKRLKDRISAMRHHLCLLEFGLGSIATLLLEEEKEGSKRKGLEDEGDEIPTATCTTSSAGGSLEAKSEDKVGDEGSVGKTACGNDCDKASCGKYRKIVMGIGGILADVESAMVKIAKDEDDKDTTMSLASTSKPNRNWNGGSEVGPRHTFGDEEMEIMAKSHKKDRIYIDEKQPGENVLTGVCNIKIVENAGLYGAQSSSVDLERGPPAPGATRSCSASSFRGLEALSTLASVASSVAIREEKEVGQTQENISTSNTTAQSRIMGQVGHSSPQQRTKRMPRQWRK